MRILRLTQYFPLNTGHHVIVKKNLRTRAAFYASYLVTGILRGLAPGGRYGVIYANSPPRRDNAQGRCQYALSGARQVDARYLLRAMSLKLGQVLQENAQ